MRFRFSIKDWLLFVLLLSVGGQWYLYSQDTVRWTVLFTAKELRASASSLDIDPDFGRKRVPHVLRVYAHWLEHAVGEQPTSDASNEP